MYCVLLLILLHCCKLKAQHGVFTINKVTLLANPHEQVQNGMPLTLNCSADVIKSDYFRLNYTFLFSKYGKVVFNSTSEQAWAAYPIPKALFSDSGGYECTLKAKGKTKSSESVTVKVKGIMKPKLTVWKTQVMEGETVSLRCEIPEEKPPFFFTFYKIPQFSVPLKKNKTLGPVNENYAELAFPVDAGDKILQFECTVTMNSIVGREESEPSNRTIVTVIEPFSKPTITIYPSHNITEGDKIDIQCTTVVGRQSQTEILIQNNTAILNSTKGREKVTYSKIATMEDNGNYTCKVELGSVSKISIADVVVTELFSKPKLIIQETNLDEDSLLEVQCQVNSPLPKSFSLLKNNEVLTSSNNYSSQAKVSDSGAYVCKAEVKGIVKESDPVSVRVYAPVSQPVLSQPASQVAVLGKYFVLYCSSTRGTPPITYTLFRGDVLKNRTVVKNNTPARFEVQAMDMHPLGEYTCLAQNGHSRKEKSTGLNITVIAPIGNVSLGRLPEGDVEDGQDFTLLCSISSGSFPISFSFFQENNKKSLYQVIERKKYRALWHRTGITSQDAGRYFCRADNQAKSSAESNRILVNVVLASWKKVLIVIAVLFPLVIALAALLYYYFKKPKAKGNSLELASSMPATNSMSEKLTSGQNNEREFFYGYNEDGEKNHINSKEANKGSDLENAEVEYTEVEVSVPDPYRAPVTKSETVYTEIRKAVNDAGENRHSRIEGSPDGT